MQLKHAISKHWVSANDWCRYPNILIFIINSSFSHIYIFPTSEADINPLYITEKKTMNLL